MRRLKSEVLAELPEKIVQDRNCELSQLQRKFYEMLVERCSLVKTTEKEDETGRRDHFIKFKNHRQINGLLHFNYCTPFVNW